MAIGSADGLVCFAAITDLVIGKVAGGVYDGTVESTKYDGVWRDDMSLFLFLFLLSCFLAPLPLC